MWLGAHIGIADGIALAPATGRSIGCDAIQIFSKSPQMWAGPPLADGAAEAFRSAVVREELRATAVHHGYLINLASPKPPMLRKSRSTFLDEIERAEKLAVDGLIFHCGAHLGSGSADGLRALTESLNEAIAATAGYRVRLLLENSAGQGTTLCATLEELAQVLDSVTDRERVGVTLDTCHLLAAGIDFRSEAAYGALVDAVRATIGVESVRAFHLNDAKAELGSHLDRHANIGTGQIGAEGFRPLVGDPRWKHVPGYLETPLDDRGYACYVEDLARLRALLPGASSAGRTPRSRRSAAAGAKP